MNNGNYTSLLNNSDIKLNNLNLEIPNISCSFSFIKFAILISYTKANYYENQINNVLIKFNITNFDSFKDSIKYIIFKNRLYFTYKMLIYLLI